MNINVLMRNNRTTMLNGASKLACPKIDQCNVVRFGHF